MSFHSRGRGAGYGGLISTHVDHSRPTPGSFGGRGAVHQPTPVTSALEEVFQPRYAESINVAYAAIRELTDVVAEQKEILASVVKHIQSNPSGTTGGYASTSHSPTSNPRTGALSGHVPEFKPKDVPNPRMGASISQPRTSVPPTYQEPVETYEAQQRRQQETELAQAAAKEREMIIKYKTVSIEQDPRFTETRDIIIGARKGNDVIAKDVASVLEVTRLSDVVVHEYHEKANPTTVVGFTANVLVVNTNISARKDLFMANLRKNNVNDFTVKLKAIIEDGAVNDIGTLIYARKLNNLLTDELNTYLDGFYHLQVSDWATDFFDLHEAILSSFGEDSATLFGTEIERLFERVVISAFQAFRDNLTDEEWKDLKEIPFIYYTPVYYTDRYALVDGLIDLPETNLQQIDEEDANLERIIRNAQGVNKLRDFYIVTRDETVIRVTRNRRNDLFLKRVTSILF